MKGRLAALDHLPDGRQAAALMVDGQLHDLLIDPPEGRGDAIPGAIFRAIADRPLKGMGGMIVRLPDGQTGFLRETKGIAPGKPLLVQVSTATEQGKAPPVTTRLMFKSRYSIVTPGAPGSNISRQIRDEEERARLAEIAHAAGVEDSLGLILRSAAEGVEEDELATDIADMLHLARQVLADAEGAEPQLLVAAPGAHLLAWREWTDPGQVDSADGSFSDHGIWDAIRSLTQPHVPLPGGGGCYIEPTRALVAVDVNTGGDNSPAAGLKANIAALRALPRQLTLRGLAGQVVIDLAPYPRKERQQLEQALKRALKADGIETTLAGWTPLGHLELQRKRDRYPLTEVLKDALPDL